MYLLAFGLAVFIVTHLFPRAHTARKAAIETLGAGAYHAIFGTVSLIATALIVIGYLQSGFEPVYEPLSPEEARRLARTTMPFAFLLVVGALFPCNLKRLIRAPAPWGVLLWALTHLAGNGDLASVMLFGGLGLYALLDLAIFHGRPPAAPPARKPYWTDLALAGVAMLLFAAAMWAHGEVFGLSVIR